MSTVRDLIKGALKLIGVYGPSETPTADEQADGLVILNEMIDSWSTENLIIYTKPREEFPLVAGTQSYTMGLTGNFNTSKPIQIENAAIKDGTNEIPIDIINKDQWARISDKSATSTIPSKLFVDHTHPLMTLYFWPTPTEVKNAVLYSSKALTQFPSVNTTVILPSGYSKALRYNLAIELGPEYGKSATPEIVMGASESKANVKRANMKSNFLAVDGALVSRGGFNILTGE